MNPILSLNERDLNEFGAIVDELPYKYAVRILEYLARKGSEQRLAGAQQAAGQVLEQDASAEVQASG